MLLNILKHAQTDEQMFGMLIEGWIILLYLLSSDASGDIKPALELFECALSASAASALALMTIWLRTVSWRAIWEGDVHGQCRAS